MRRALLVLSPILVPFLFGMTGCKPKIKDSVVVDDHIEIAPPTVTLQVAGIDPAFNTANQSFLADIFGSGFAKGATVQIGSFTVGNVAFQADSSLGISVPAMPAGSYDVTVINPDGKRATLRNGLTLQAEAPKGPACPPLTVYFDLDSSMVKAESKAQLDGFAACVRSAQVQVRVEGHCDERGTTEYNLSLGQRRADAVSRYLGGTGIPKTWVQSVSYGEERPAVMGGGEDAWARNRRAELSVVVGR